MTRKIVSVVIGVLLIFLFLGGMKFLQIRKIIAAGASAGPPPEAVTSAVVREETWPSTLAAIGSVSAVQGVIVSAEVSGTVKSIAFESGGTVDKGDLLVQIDASVEEAQLRSAEANAQLTRLDVDRARDLQKRNVIAKSEMDTAEAKFAQGTAEVENLKSVIAKKTIRAPFAGRLGIREINVGQVVNAGQHIVPLQALNPVFVDFSLPQQRLPDIAVGMVINVTTDAAPDRQFSGKLTALNSSLDTATRSVGVQATLENADEVLKPGMFAKVEVVLPQKNPVLIIPATAVSYAPYGDSVFVIESKHDEKSGKESPAIRQQFIRLGETRGDFVAVTSGLKAGETVASTGIFKLRNGMAVQVNNELAPNPQIAPKPADT
jgi:membrane fusion protein (multidrug efflux system)